MFISFLLTKLYIISKKGQNNLWPFGTENVDFGAILLKRGVWLPSYLPIPLVGSTPFSKNITESDLNTVNFLIPENYSECIQCNMIWSGIDCFIYWPNFRFLLSTKFVKFKINFFWCKTTPTPIIAMGSRWPFFSKYSTKINWTYYSQSSLRFTLAVIRYSHHTRGLKSLAGYDQKFLS